MATSVVGRLQPHAAGEAAAGGRPAGVVASWPQVEQADAGADRALAVGVRVQGLAGRALGEGEAPDPLGGGGGGAGRPDSLGPAVAELVAVERAAEVEELGAGLCRRGSHRRHDRARAASRGPVRVGVPERAAALVEPAPSLLGVAEPGAGRERRGVAHRHQAVVAAPVAGGRHRPPHADQGAADPAPGGGQGRVDLGLGVTAAVDRVLGGAARPVECAGRHQFAEADVVGADRDEDHADVVVGRDARQPVRLRGLAEVRSAAECRRPEVHRPGSGAGEVDAEVDRHRGADRRRHVGAMAAVTLAGAVDAGGVVLADAPAVAVEGRPVGPRAGPERLGAVAQPAAALAGDEAVAE